MTGFGQNTPLAAERPAWYTHSMDDVRGALAANLAELRKEENLTQAEFAAQFNYSDKAVSKWERGDSLPDVVMLKTIADLCIRYDVYAIMDEVYEHIIYDGRKHIYMNSIPGMWERTVSCSSLSKTYSVTGWRLGYAIAPENIMARIRQYHDFNAVGCPSPLMEAAVVGLNMPLSYYDEFGAHYAHMKKIFTEGMRDIGIPFTDPEGTYFVLADISPYLKKGQSDVDFCEQLARKAGVGAVPGSSFFNEPINNIVRLHFAKKDETLYAALDRLNHIKDMM